MRRQPDQIVAVGAIAMQQHHQLRGLTTGGGKARTGEQKPWLTKSVSRFRAHDRHTLRASSDRVSASGPRLCRHGPRPDSGERFLLRLEDMDQGRAREEFVAAIFEDLAWLGLSWDEPVLRQSSASTPIAQALAKLAPADLSLLLHPQGDRRRNRARRSRRRTARDPMARSIPAPAAHLSAEARAARIARGETYALRLDAAKAAAQTGPLSFHRAWPDTRGRSVAVRRCRAGAQGRARRPIIWPWWWTTHFRASAW